VIVTPLGFPDLLLRKYTNKYLRGSSSLLPLFASGEIPLQKEETMI
jgi:hypothetical protein